MVFCSGCWRGYSLLDMRASACVGRVGGLAVALGVGAAIALGGSPVAGATSSGDAVAGDAARGESRTGALEVRRVPPATARRVGSSEAPTVTAPAVTTRRLLAPPPITPRIAARTVARATAPNPFTAFFFNQTPTIAPTQTAQSPAGVVTGDLRGLDPDSHPLTYTVVSNPLLGAVSIDAAGGYSYTPDPPLGHGGITDTFSVAVSDARSGFHIHGLAGLINLLTFGLVGASQHTTIKTVTVTVGPVNTAPVSSVSVGAPNASTGVVLGKVNAVDADGDPLNYSGPTTTAKGAVAVAADGGFTYTPTDTARHNAASVTATTAQTTDTFTVMITDGYGANVEVPVTVTIGPANIAPIGVSAVGSPNASTGVVAGNVIASDADGDRLTYGGPATTAKGAVVVATDGGFTYTPTSATRHAAASLTATAADRIDSFALIVSDGHGGTVGVPVTVAIAPATGAATAAPSVGLPDATTGVVAGAILGADADGDALRYTGSAAAKGTVVVSANGNFTYTPTALARHAAASPTATEDDTTDTFLVTVTDGYGGSRDVVVGVMVSPAAISYNFVYTTGSEYWSADARSALQTAASALASRIVVNRPVTITYTVIGESIPDGPFLASAFSPFSSSSPGFDGTVVQKKILTGVDANGATADSRITWNFAYPWALGDSVANDEYDFQSVAAHEILHTLGFQTGLGDPANIDRNWTTFDGFLSTSDGTAVVGADYLWNADYTANLTGGGGGLYFDGPHAVQAYGGLVPLYTPGAWVAGTSVSHLDSADAPAGTTYLMDPTDLYGPGPRVITSVEAAILTDLGYTVSPGYALFFIGFGFLRRRRGSAAHQRAPLFEVGRPVDVVVPLDIREVGAGLGGVPVAREHHRVAGQSGQLLQAAEHLIDVAAGEVGAPAPVEEQGVAGNQAAVEQEALASRRVARGVQQFDVDGPDRDRVAVVMFGEIAHRDPGDLRNPLCFMGIDVNRDADPFQ